MFSRIINWFEKWNWAYKNDPIKDCQLYNDKGCSYIDGFLCNFPSCSMNEEYIKNIKK